MLSLPHTHAHYTHSVVFGCVTSVLLFFLPNNHWAAPPHFLPSCVYMSPALFMHHSPASSLLRWLVIGSAPADGGGGGGLGRGRCHLPLQAPPVACTCFKTRLKPTDSTSPLISVQLPLCLQHTKNAHIYIYIYI
ncbi:hypothetical protein PAMA_008935 [Pampus argenteus]